MSFAETIEREAAPKGANAITMLWGTKQLKAGFSSYLALYEGFVGQTHFQVISKLLGYQGIAMILEQLLTNMDGQVGVWGIGGACRGRRWRCGGWRDL